MIWAALQPAGALAGPGAGEEEQRFVWGIPVVAAAEILAVVEIPEGAVVVGTLVVTAVGILVVAGIPVVAAAGIPVVAVAVVGTLVVVVVFLPADVVAESR